MITLYTFGPAFGLPDPSPFVTKAEVLLKMSGLSYRTDINGFGKAPKGKLPYIDDGGTIVADSSFIRWHLEQRHGIDFDKGLDAYRKGIAWAAEKLCEDNLYWAVLDSRWMVDANFDKGPRQFFDRAPGPIRPLITTLVRRRIRTALKAHGIGRHARPDIERIGLAGIDALAGILGDSAWLGGDVPCGSDASVWAFTNGLFCPLFAGPMLDHVARKPNLVAYRDRGLLLWFPELRKTA